MFSVCVYVASSAKATLPTMAGTVFARMLRADPTWARLIVAPSAMGSNPVTGEPSMMPVMAVSTSVKSGPTFALSVAPSIATASPAPASRRADGCLRRARRAVVAARLRGRRRRGVASVPWRLVVRAATAATEGTAAALRRPSATAGLRPGGRATRHHRRTRRPEREAEEPRERRRRTATPEEVHDGLQRVQDVLRSRATLACRIASKTRSLENERFPRPGFVRGRRSRHPGSPCPFIVAGCAPDHLALQHDPASQHADRRGARYSPAASLPASRPSCRSR